MKRTRVKENAPVSNEADWSTHYLFTGHNEIGMEENKFVMNEGTSQNLCKSLFHASHEKLSGPFRELGEIRINMNIEDGLKLRFFPVTVSFLCNITYGKVVSSEIYELFLIKWCVHGLAFLGEVKRL